MEGTDSEGRGSTASEAHGRSNGGRSITAGRAPGAAPSRPADAAAAPAQAPAPRRSFASRLFGYDTFLSFALGPPPRGTRGYASDLARRLRDRDFTVFFSEDEAPAGGQLNNTLRSALLRSRTLVVIANRDTLLEPRWVRTEVQEFRTRRPDRPVIAINVGGALQDEMLAEAVQEWLGYRGRIWVDESAEAVAAGSATDRVVDRLATAPSWAKASVKWRWVVRGAVGALAGLAAALAVAAKVATDNAARAESVVARATDTAHQLVFELASQFKERVGVPNDLIVRTLGLSEALMEDLAAGGETQPAVLRTRALALTELAAALRSKGDAEGAAGAAETAVALFDRMAATPSRGAVDPRDAQAERSAAYDRLGDARAALRDRSRARRAYEQSVAILEELVKANPGGADLRRNLAVGYEKLADEKLADVRAGEERLAAALGAYNRSLALRGELASAAGSTVEARRDLSVSYEKIGDTLMLMREGRADDALQAYRQSFELAEALASGNPDRADFARDLASAHQRIGDAKLAQGLLSEALRHFRKDVQITTRLAQSDPDNVAWQRDLSVSHRKTGEALHLLANLGDALLEYGRSCSILNRLATLGNPDDAWLIASCAKRTSELLVESRNVDEAARIAERHLGDVRGRHDRGADQALLVDALGNAAWYALLARRPGRAVDLLEEALSAAPGNLWLELNKAHATMLSGSEEDAAEVYLSHADDTIPGQGRWCEAVLADFRAMRGVGIRSPAMARVEAALGRQTGDLSSRPDTKERPR